MSYDFLRPRVLEAIKAINPSAEISIMKDDVDRIQWFDTPEIPKADILAKRDELIVEWNAQEYARNRAAEYPSIAELTVALYDTDDKTAIETKRAAVKAKYPKPS